ncbi:cytochrome c family protein [Pararhizobium antarcticum]|uniref:Cytochrome c family protein n=2 Tax=Pararhizobium antarcticum TaxID=1798805 RepID=A0A657LU36_9HYPH|nr:cytochrome c family protein [Pararhizobium antarcticum]OJF92994.1 cytochrome c family protein [Rhizobium sp. 58]OJF96966.1 cytochrome c family protein [Pararhizobium antarcticum]
MSFRAVLLSLCLLLAAGSVRADGDAAAGAQVFRKCGACHSATEAENRVGPSLMGILGRPVATVPDYNYSSAMASFGEDGKLWDEGRLSDYLLSPKSMVPGTKMTFAGLRKPTDIVNLIAYLKSTVVGK